MYRIATIYLLCLILTTSTMAKSKKISIKIIETSDVHGYFFPFDFIEQSNTKGSMARISSYVKRERDKYGKNLILIDNGDILQGQPTCYYYNYIATSETNIAAQISNYMGYDIQVPGNHDIETGHNVYDKWINELNCSVVGANIIRTDTKQPYVSPYKIIIRDGIRIAVLGMLTPAIPNWLNKSLWNGMTFESIKTSADKWIRHLKEVEKADIVIGLFHSGWNGGISTLHYNEDETESVATDICGFDLIFFGHDHTRRIENVTNKNGQKVVCINPSCNALMVGEANIDIEIGNNNQIISKKIEGNIHDISDENIDTEFISTFQSQIDKIRDYVKTPIGFLTDTIRTRDCFFGSAPFTDLIHNLQLQITGADVSFNAPLSFNIEVASGPIRMSDMFKLYRYENQIYVLNMSGKEIRNHLEMSYDLWVNTMTGPDDHIMLLDDKSSKDMQRYGFKNLTFNFDSAAGIDYIVDVSKPNGYKVKIIKMSNGEPFDENKIYKVVMNSYRGNGGGELLTRGAGISKSTLPERIIYQSEKDQRYYLTKEIERIKIIHPKANCNWHFVPEEWVKPAIERDRKLLFGN